ncbi:MAG: MBL fold metallo-hydrolase [Oscillospiraceae bacterium]|jgi:L-ascorbate metabolism protein UlaG (beta-lactamase superfamily)|nr:MBL fold metallo-hydrolase [Oscillospiraceae bacterium]
MTVTWLGNASVVLESGGQRLYFDPFFPLGTAEDVFITHGHYDHLYYVPQMRGCRVRCTKTPAERVDGATVIRVGDVERVGAFEVRVLRGRHTRFGARLILSTALRVLKTPSKVPFFAKVIREFPENDETVMFDVRAEDKRVVVMGSLALDADTVYETGADCLILPYQGYSDNLAAALPIVRRLAPKMVILDHFDDAFPPVSQEIDVEPFLSAVECAVKPVMGVAITI